MADAVPTFSVCIPTYNRAQMLRHAIRSVLDQSVADFELVVLDNGSTDETSIVLEEEKSDRLRVVRYETTVSMYANHNRCLQHARGAWIVFVHSDERLVPDALLRYRDAIAQGPVATMLMPAADRTVLQDMYRFWRVKTVTSARAGALVLSGIGSVSGTCFRRDALINAGGFAVDKEVEYAADHDLYGKLAALSAEFRFVNFPIELHTAGPHQATHLYTRGSAAPRALAAVVRRMAARPGWDEIVAHIASEIDRWPASRAASVAYLLALGAPEDDYAQVAQACRTRAEIRRSRPYAISRLIHRFGPTLYLRALDLRAALR